MTGIQVALASGIVIGILVAYGWGRAVRALELRSAEDRGRRRAFREAARDLRRCSEQMRVEAQVRTSAGLPGALMAEQQSVTFRQAAGLCEELEAFVQGPREEGRAA